MRMTEIPPRLPLARLEVADGPEKRATIPYLHGEGDRDHYLTLIDDRDVERHKPFQICIKPGQRSEGRKWKFVHRLGQKCNQIRA